MRCPRCQHENREGRRFCAKCGATLSMTCASCGFSNEPGENFCGGCGQALQAAATPPAPKFAAPQAYTPMAHCHLGLGRLYRRTGKGQEAQEHLVTAIAMYREMDMRFWLEKAEAELRELG